MKSLNYAEIAKEVLEIESQALLEATKRIDGAEIQAIVEKIIQSRGKLVVCGVGKSGLIGAKISATLSSTGTPSVFMHPTEALHGDLGMLSRGKLVVCGVGKSGLIGAKISATLSSTGTPSVFMHPTEALHGDLGMLQKDDILLAISYSGKSEELLSIIPHIKCFGNTIITMSRDKLSPLSILGDYFLDISIMREACPLNIAPTSSTTLTLALGDALAVCLMKARDFKAQDFASFHPGGAFEACPLNIAPTSSTTLTLALGDALAVCLMKARDFKAQDFASFHPGGALGKQLFVKLKDLMQTQDLPIIPPEMPLSQAIIIISQKRLGNAIIAKDNVIWGILSDGDLRRAMMKQDFSLESPVSEYATQNPKVCDNQEILAYDALKMMEDNKIQLLVITDKHKHIQGAIHLHTLISAGLK